MLLNKSLYCMFPDPFLPRVVVKVGKGSGYARLPLPLLIILDLPLITTTCSDHYLIIAKPFYFIAIGNSKLFSRTGLSYSVAYKHPYQSGYMPWVSLLVKSDFRLCSEQGCNTCCHIGNAVYCTMNSLLWYSHMSST